ncbi:MAG: HAD family hydrolase [Clostridia bacterium]|nr:HAD family hydrolase [Clostridia bacterium]
MADNKKAVFLDRDGVICKEKSYITSVNQLEIFQFAIDAVKMLKDSGWLCIVITNQSAVARGMMTEDELERIHEVIYNTLPVDRIYYCPHHPEKAAYDSPYRVKCDCRKPGTGMILSAARDFNIDLNQSFFVGDRSSDIMAGKKAGLKTVLVKTGYDISGIEVEPDFVFDNIMQTVHFITGKQ